MSLSSLPTTNDFLDKYQPSSDQMRRRRFGRIVAGAVYGLLLGAIYALVNGTIDALTFPDLPLRVEWASLGLDVGISGLGGMVLGALAAWPANAWVGTLVGAGAIVAWEMLRSLVRLSNPLGLFLLIFILPLIVLSLPMAAVFRWSVSRHVQVMQRPRLRRRLMGVGGLVLAIVALAAFAGSWSRMTGTSEGAVRKVNSVLQAGLAASNNKLPEAFRNVTDLHAQAGHAYWLSQQASLASPTGIDVQITFDNGYAVTCFVETEAGQAQLITCAKGAQSLFGPARYNPNDQR
jgi:MFS family permease